MRKFLVMIISLSLAIAINPPQNGNFPEGFWEKMNDQNIGQAYGDPGWAVSYTHLTLPTKRIV